MELLSRSTSTSSETTRELARKEAIRERTLSLPCLLFVPRSNSSLCILADSVFYCMNTLLMWHDCIGDRYSTTENKVIRYSHSTYNQFIHPCFLIHVPQHTRILPKHLIQSLQRITYEGNKTTGRRRVYGNQGCIGCSEL